MSSGLETAMERLTEEHTSSGTSNFSTEQQTWVSTKIFARTKIAHTLPWF